MAVPASRAGATRAGAAPDISIVLDLTEHDLAPSARLDLLGGFRYSEDGAAVALPISSQRLLAFLALEGREVLRPHLAATLWLDSTEERAFASLRTALWRLRRAGAARIESFGPYLMLDPEVSVDVHALTATARLAKAGMDPGRHPLRRLEAETLLPGWHDDWLTPHRERLAQLRLRALEILCASLAERGRFEEAVQAGLLAVAADPLRETAHLHLIRALLAQGNRAEALRRYHTLRLILEAELGVEPSPELRTALAGLLP